MADHSSSDASDEEKPVFRRTEMSHSRVSLESKEAAPSEAGSAASSAAPPVYLDTIPLAYERPDIVRLIREAVEDTPPTQRILVKGCGPDALMTAVRNTTAECIRTDGPGVELHCEQFGW